MSRIIVGLLIAAGAVAGLAAAPRAQDRGAAAAAGERFFVTQGCYGCHTVGRFGTPIGPDLSHVGAKYSREYLARWLADPKEQRPRAHMPKLELTGEEIEALSAYLASLR